MMGFKETRYFREHMGFVKHVTLNPGSEGVVRIHMVPPGRSVWRRVPSVIILNGQDILPIGTSWAILLSSFMDEIQRYDGKDMGDGDWDDVIGKTIAAVKRVYGSVREETLRGDLWRIIKTLTDVAAGRAPDEELGALSLAEYAGHMTAPHRMDLMLSALSRGGAWHCNNKCLHCYAARQPLSEAKELTTDDWKRVIDLCREAGIPQLTFTGGEPTLRDDLVELVDYSKWFITRLNTNGVLLTEALCRGLCAASLDSVQVTLYSSDPAAHNKLVGAESFDKTVQGIKNAVSAGLSVSVNTPLCALNRDYTATLRFLKGLGVRYVSCSGLIPAGNARSDASAGTQLNEEELAAILKSAVDYCRENDIDISFTSPGWVSEARLREIGFKTVPSCGACLSNMAVAPDGTVVPCQSWLSDPGLGNMLTTPWREIWNGRRCREIRAVSAKMEKRCQLGGKSEECCA
ncbi:radical SAM additional 4Fe4S-binding SPASM domain-containing protein [Sporobacter termitidis DSM 10068]|uniref:Radical SAM additional 4Fe4S-binding SPASM domain-containing protein n=1 Tax=Sporobacter termitidis DSM 10068 TaxID=1123282 RepID=A0A1M5YJT7_9FIRM|nr:radical SAM protein [Sporobacter termitidis]SHI12291.1 radical SAM additional 4Fe4S-binding SPASM domain-containing protein [Sporobacter termitidis DSM 10068]